MHGSDAHAHEDVAVPAEHRYSWLKGIVAFDTLRQACIDPGGRAYVGPAHPAAAVGSQVIATVEVADAQWFKTSPLGLNPGLVAIIGARGSGKTALADIIALGCDATATPLSPSSFLARAKDLLSEGSVTLKSETGDERRRCLDNSDSDRNDAYPRARYLSQQFVEELCTASGITDALLAEIERVIFEAHPTVDRDGAIDFNELLDLRVSRFRLAREREEESILNISERIGNELDKSKLVPTVKKQVQEKEKLITGYVRDRARLVSKGSEVRMERLSQLSEAADKVRSYLRYFKTQEQSLLALSDDVANFRRSQAPEALRRTEERFKASGLQVDDWKAFLLDYCGDVDSIVSRHLIQSRKGAKEWTGNVPPALQDIQIPYIPEGVPLDRQSLAVLETEIARLQRLINVDRDMAAKFTALSKRITEESTALTALKAKLTDCEGAKERATGLVTEREAAYARVFESIVDEVNVLARLYEPLLARLRGSSETLAKLSFSVHRDADVGRWAATGEELFDLRQSGQFRGRGTLRELGETALREAWETGDPQTATRAMRTFRSDNQEELLDRASVSKADASDYRSWLKRFAKWLYGTDHIVIRYSINYDGVDIRKLSPGTRGIVLLLLYLALDDADDRPLIIDQPEESLDPKSVFDELVTLFVAAKQKRQVIIVTHNANLVVNTDADQIIVARAGPHAVGELPPITYQSGGLEEEQIRRAVCDILEGGEAAFRERARRLRVALDR
jgi:energy-coupling factor transporter ATP-binding protein EcfA2